MAFIKVTVAIIPVLKNTTGQMLAHANPDNTHLFGKVTATATLPIKQSKTAG